MREPRSTPFNSLELGMVEASSAFVPLPGALPDCELCVSPGGLPIVSISRWRVVRVPDSDFPAFYRLVWNEHRAELSDLDADERLSCWSAVVAIEQVLRTRLSPTKINLASLGNLVPHLHWHVIARFDWDSHFPQPIWGLRQREVEGGAQARLRCSLVDLDAAVKAAVMAAENAPPG